MSVHKNPSPSSVGWQGQMLKNPRPNLIHKIKDLFSRNRFKECKIARQTVTVKRPIAPGCIAMWQ